MDRIIRELAEHDRALVARGHGVWAGAEPTFTDASSESAEWLFHALGGDKEHRAGRIAVALLGRQAGAVLLRPAGRPYSGETAPRWCHGVYAARDGSAVWDGPADPLQVAAPGHAAPDDLEQVARAVARALQAAGWPARLVRADDPLPLRLAFRFDGEAVPSDPASEPRLARPSVHRRKVRGVELEDDLAGEGVGLVLLGVRDDALAGRAVLRLELPAVPCVGEFRRLLGALCGALRESGVDEVVLAGHPPPVDASVSWTTVTPDPAVVEINLAPQASANDFHAELLAAHAAAAGEGLAPRRLHYNGLETDSGGGGQITLGGTSPRTSPFLTAASLLPSLVRYFNRHPALSYWWSPEAAGAASQGPRPDEGLRESLRELDLALALLDGEADVSPATLHASLAPFLVDGSGNAHRSELNVEKLWSDRLGDRGRLGLVEFRALRMAAEPELLSAITALLRALTAMLAERALDSALVDWGDELHDRFSLPFYLRQDLRAVLSELTEHGLGLGPGIEALLLDDTPRRIAELRLPGANLHLSRAVEFWPLLGDVASQEQGGARLVDASTARLELRLTASDPDEALDRWRVTVHGVHLPLHGEHDDRGPCRVAGLRYRTFEPVAGLHPTLEAQAPLTLYLHHPDHGAHSLTLHEWRPDGGPYDGLPADRGEAARRRAERCVLAAVPAVPHAEDPPARACGRHVLDLRWLAPVTR